MTAVETTHYAAFLEALTRRGHLLPSGERGLTAAALSSNGCGIASMTWSPASARPIGRAATLSSRDAAQDT